MIEITRLNRLIIENANINKDMVWMAARMIEPSIKQKTEEKELVDKIRQIKLKYYNIVGRDFWLSQSPFDNQFWLFSTYTKDEALFWQASCIGYDLPAALRGKNV